MQKEQKIILAVEDDNSLREALRLKLEHEGYSVLEAENGADGLKMALAERPDLILLDIVMPKMDGMAMLRKLREDEWGKDAKVILLTNLTDLDKTNEAMELKSYDYFVKSDWKIADVVEKVKSLIG